MWRSSGRPGPVLVDITKDAQQIHVRIRLGSGSSRSCRVIGPICRPTPEEYEQALELIHNAKRPVILAGHGIIISGAMHEVRDFAERTGIPVALTLLGLGAFPGVASAESRHDGHARRGLGESHDSGSRSAARVRHAV